MQIWKKSGFSNYYKIDSLLLWDINSTKCETYLSFVYFTYDTTFNMDYDHNLLYYNNCIYKYMDFNDNISQINIYYIRKEYSLNYFTILKYQPMLVDKILVNKLGGRNIRLIPPFN